MATHDEDGTQISSAPRNTSKKVRHHAQGIFLVTGVVVHLTTTGLCGAELNCVP